MSLDMFAVGTVSGSPCTCGGTASCGSCCVPCSPCPIPKADLFGSWTGGSGSDAPPSGSGTLAYYPGGLGYAPYTGPSWAYNSYLNPTGSPTGCFVTCYGGTIYVELCALWWNGTAYQTTCVDQTCFSLTSTTCNPFSVTYTISGTGLCLTPGGPFFTSVTISAAAYGVSVCCQGFSVTGCGGYALPSATVSVYSSYGGTLLASGVTPANGIVSLLWAASCSVYVTVTDSASRFTAYGSSLSLTVNSTTAISLSVASGYYCLTTGSCSYPLPATLHATFANAGAQVFTWTAGPSLWTSTFTYLSVPYSIGIAPNGTMTCYANSVPFTSTFAVTSCPVAPGFAGTITVPGSGTGSAIGNGTITE